jgi:hypothetical protein
MELNEVLDDPIAEGVLQRIVNSPGGSCRPHLPKALDEVGEGNRTPAFRAGG